MLQSACDCRARTLFVKMGSALSACRPYTLTCSSVASRSYLDVSASFCRGAGTRAVLRQHMYLRFALRLLSFRSNRSVSRRFVTSSSLAREHQNQRPAAIGNDIFIIPCPVFPPTPLDTTGAMLRAQEKSWTGSPKRHREEVMGGEQRLLQAEYFAGMRMLW
jgi:hypothetical protein